MAGFADGIGRDLVIRTIAGEAAQEGPDGWRGIAHVIMNRYNNGNYGTGLRQILRPDQFTANRNPLKLDPSNPLYTRIGAVVDEVFEHRSKDPTNGATHYYNPKLANPDWGPGMRGQTTIGNHLFGQADAPPRPPANVPSGVNTEGLESRTKVAVETLAGTLKNAGIPLTVISGYRDPAHNAAVGGAKHSQHTEGRAIDIDLKGLTPEQKQVVVHAALRTQGVNGFGYYPSSDTIHIDTRPGVRAAWGANYHKESIGQGWPEWLTPLVNAWHTGQPLPEAPAAAVAVAAAAAPNPLAAAKPGPQAVPASGQPVVANQTTPPAVVAPVASVAPTPADPNANAIRAATPAPVPATQAPVPSLDTLPPPPVAAPTTTASVPAQVAAPPAQDPGLIDLSARTLATPQPEPIVTRPSLAQRRPLQESLAAPPNAPRLPLAPPVPATEPRAAPPVQALDLPPDAPLNDVKPPPGLTVGPNPPNDYRPPPNLPLAPGPPNDYKPPPNILPPDDPNNPNTVGGPMFAPVKTGDPAVTSGTRKLPTTPGESTMLPLPPRRPPELGVSPGALAPPMASQPGSDFGVMLDIARGGTGALAPQPQYAPGAPMSPYLSSDQNPFASIFTKLFGGGGAGLPPSLY